MENTQQDTVVALTPGENYAKIVHYKSLQKLEDIAPKHNGSFVCNNWHLRGFCFHSCKRANTHTSLPLEIKAKYRTYVTALRKEAKEFSNKTPPRLNFTRARNNSYNRDNTGENTQQNTRTD